MILPWIYFHISAHRDYTCQTGVDDGFIIKASADTGVADWIVHYPQSNQDTDNFWSRLFLRQGGRRRFQDL